MGDKQGEELSSHFLAIEKYFCGVWIKKKLIIFPRFIAIIKRKYPHSHYSHTTESSQSTQSDLTHPNIWNVPETPLFCWGWSSAKSFTVVKFTIIQTLLVLTSLYKIKNIKPPTATGAIYPYVFLHGTFDRR